MTGFITFLFFLALAATAGVLLVGIWGFCVKKNPDPERNNRLMRLRVLFQMATLFLFAVLLFLKK